ncbi:MAG: hypothetical protein J6J78_03355 [Clostridia bacterium]|nr:hypothetical protein [Clostridia bacterium]MBP3652094.1 hypothetical protein [Clostridia bacterium]
MKKNSALAGFISRFQAILEELDQFEMDEELEEMNAEFEDALFMMETIDEDGEDAAEEIADAMEDMDDLLARYRALCGEHPELGQKVLELEMAVQMAKNNLN